MLELRLFPRVLTKQDRNWEATSDSFSFSSSIKEAGSIITEMFKANCSSIVAVEKIVTAVSYFVSRYLTFHAMEVAVDGLPQRKDRGTAILSFSVPSWDCYHQPSCNCHLALQWWPAYEFSIEQWELKMVWHRKVLILQQLKIVFIQLRLIVQTYPLATAKLLLLPIDPDCSLSALELCSRSWVWNVPWFREN